jgi:hypothetical protein
LKDIKKAMPVIAAIPKIINRYSSIFYLSFPFLGVIK